ncbi:MAG TPA: hypothetical protein V6D08_19755 [Candidatus Obscuribacterales bacterium]
MRIGLLVVLIAALGGCNTSYECTTAQDAGADVNIPWYLALGLGLGIGALGLGLGMAAGAALGIGIGLGGALGLGAAAFGIGFGIGSNTALGDQIADYVFGTGAPCGIPDPNPPGPGTTMPGGSQSPGFSGSRDADTSVPGQSGIPSPPGPPGPSGTMPGGNQSPGYSGSRDADTTMPGQGPAPPEAVTGSTPEAGSAGGTAAGDSSSPGSGWGGPRGGDTTATAPLDTADGLSLADLLRSEGIDLSGGSSSGGDSDAREVIETLKMLNR